MKLIVACDPKGGIGYNNKLPWSKIEGDLPRFKELTTGKNVVMGKRTWESLPFKPLPNRHNYVLSKVSIPGAVTMGDVNLLPNTAGDDAWIIGGGNVIRQCWGMIDEIHLTKTFVEYECDTFIDLEKLEDEFVCWQNNKNSDHYYQVWKRIKRLYNYDSVVITADKLSDTDNEICDSINNSKSNEVVFDCTSEGFQKLLLDRIQSVVKKMVVDYQYNINNFVFMSGSTPVESNITAYQEISGDFLPKKIVLTDSIDAVYHHDTIDREVKIDIKPKKFLSMNGVPRTHRRLSTAWLIENKLIDDSFYSINSAEYEINDILAERLKSYSNMFGDLINIKPEPMMLSRESSDINDRFKDSDIYYFDNSYFSLVQETFFDDKLDMMTSDIPFFTNTFLTEKTYRPIYFKHPFVLLGTMGSLAALRDYGFKTFSPYIDETYDTITDPVLRLQAVLNEVKRLCSFTDDEWLSFQRDILPIVEYNHARLTKPSKPYIYYEGKRK